MTPGTLEDTFAAKEVNGVAIVKPEGDLTVKEVTVVRKRLLELLEEHSSLQIDFENFGNVDSAGVQLLLAAKLKAKERTKELSFCNQSPALLRLLDLYGLVSEFADPIKLTTSQRQNYSFTYGTRRAQENANG